MNAKKIGIFAGMLAVLIILLLSLQFFEKNTVYGVPPNKLNSETKKLLKDENYNNIILPDTLNAKIENKESFFVYYFSATCPHCLFTTPLLKPVADELGINLHQFNLLEYKQYLRAMNISVTPTLVYYKDGVEIKRLEGGLKESETTVGYSLNDFRDFFNEYKPQGND
ncbi:MAG: thioredoxin family protein [Candidatus Cohnella colombiensis]|uniref:Thioredoxin family protein n=1 Tax=Candidatus Cohnella colombiensis TaxID=3121368 RepID=A0AA95F0I8_9BACL|nr:MAG: thioredoxin family protein [Cohnella sp.]